MRTHDMIRNQYFEWLFDTVCRNRYTEGTITYRKLLMRLHDTEFRYSIMMDKNRAEDGESLRYRFAMYWDYSDPFSITDILDSTCSVLEMMVALAIRCEETITDDPTKGDRTQQWFWGMIVNLGLGSMSDDRYNREIVDNAISRFLDRNYAPDGKGGLFTVRGCTNDLRRVEIWNQLLWYLDDIMM